MYKSLKKAIEDAPASPEYRVDLAPGTAQRLLRAPPIFFDFFQALREELALEGPFRHGWPQYNHEPLRGKGQEGGHRHHCYLHCGVVTYVVWWESFDKHIKISVV